MYHRNGMGQLYHILVLESVLFNDIVLQVEAWKFDRSARHLFLPNGVFVLT